MNIEQLQNFFKKVYEEPKDKFIRSLYYPVLEALVNEDLVNDDGWVYRDEIISFINKKYNYKGNDWRRGNLSLDHLFSQRFGRGEEQDFLNELFEHNGVNAGDKKTKYKLKDTELIRKFVDSGFCKTESIKEQMDQRISYVVEQAELKRIKDTSDIKVDEENHPTIWKISHGKQKDFSNEKHNWLLENNYVATNFPPEKSDHRILDTIKPNHYFYLVRDAQIFLLGQLENEPSKEIEGMPGRCRKFKPVKMLDKPYDVKDLYREHLSFGGMPSSQSTVQKVKSENLKYFESDVLKPVFKLSLEDLAQDNAASSKGNKMQSLNQILYGPPGTGKTYNTVTEALKVLVEIIVDEEEYGDGYSKDKRRFDALKTMGHIEFITFHQSFSYEDFVEGIRAETQDGVISYSVKDGIFKKIAIEALYSKLELSGDKLEEAWQKAIATKNVIANKKITAETKFDSNDNDHKKLILSIHKMSDFKKGKGEPYVLIIDEINRGNTSRIFGELITLIESTKRAGSDEAMDAVLPYSQETFTVPDNLYIIGTMNTADRSLALIDTALRRRFDFIEMMPDITLIEDKKSRNSIKIEGVDIQEMLKTINDRIEVLYDREHTIGHAFFMKLTDDSTITDLASVFKRNILPLLEEYFFEDWKKICQVLGKSGIYEVKSFTESGLSTGNNYSRKEDLLAIPGTYINIYKDTDSTQQDSPGLS